MPGPELVETDRFDLRHNPFDLVGGGGFNTGATTNFWDFSIGDFIQEFEFPELEEPPEEEDPPEDPEEPIGDFVGLLRINPEDNYLEQWDGSAWPRVDNVEIGETDLVLRVHELPQFDPGGDGVWLSDV